KVVRREDTRQRVAADRKTPVMQIRRSRNQRRRRSARADPAEIENLQPGVAADVQEAVVEGHPACGFATTQRADEILASRSLNVADVGDVVGGQRLASKDEYQIAEPER